MGRNLLLFGNSKYDDKDNYCELDFVKRDIIELKKILELYGGFDNIKVNMECDRDSYLEEIDDFAKTLTHKDELFLYHSGHGDIDMERNQLYIVAKNTFQDKLYLKSIEAEKIVAILSRCNAKVKVLLLDCCFSGLFSTSLRKSGIQQDFKMAIEQTNKHIFSNAKGIYVITSSRANQESIKGNEYSKFTELIVEGIQNSKVEADKDGFILMDYLYNYLYSNSDKNQIPKRYFDGEGLIWMARVPLKVRNDKISYKTNTGLSKNSDLKQKILSNSRKLFSILKRPARCFYHLEISNTIICDFKKEIIETSDNDDAKGSKVSLWASIKELWNKASWHLFIVGEGGMGKTVSIIKLWENCLEAEVDNAPIPIFITLNEYKTEKYGKKRNFILHSICRDYLGIENMTEDLENQLFELISEPIQLDGSREIPRALLLLDGFNEITVDKKELITEIRDIVKRSRGVQVVITSRTDVRNNVNFRNCFNKFELMKLSDEKIAKYIFDKVEFSSNKKPVGKLWELLKNPMMLSIYVESCQIINNNIKNTNFELKERVETPGELLWNFIEINEIKYFENKEKYLYNKFLLKHMLPYLAWIMEVQGTFYFSECELEHYLNSAFNRFENIRFRKTFRHFINCEKMGFNISRLSEVEELIRFEEIKTILLCELNMMVKEKNKYRFLHHNFRDYFSAVHILNEIDICLACDDYVPDALSQKLVPYHVRKFIGEIEQEHYNIPIYIKVKKAWSIEHYKETRLTKLIDRFRKNFENDVAMIVWNVIKILIDSRKELTGMDLSYLNLSKTTLSGIRFSREGNFAVPFDGAMLNDTNIICQGHSHAVVSVCYNATGTKILSGSWDNTIKEWCVETGKCLRTYEGHLNYVWSVAYSSNGTKILSGASDNTIKEWCTETGICLHTYEGHVADVLSVDYSPDGTKVLSGSADNTIKEWSIETGKCIKTYEGHFDYVRSITYSKDGTKILSGSYDNTIKEWNVHTGKCLCTYNGHANYVSSVVYNQDGMKILSGSYDNTIKEWDVETGECLYTYEGHTNYLRSVTYSVDETKILSGAYDNTIKEWSVSTGECLYSYQENTSYIWSVAYSPDGSKILSGCSNNIIEWHTKSGERLHIYEGYSNYVRSICYSSDGKKILSGSSDNTIKEWCVDREICFNTYEGHMNYVRCLGYSPDESKILSGSIEDFIEWCAETGKRLRKYKPHSKYIRSVVYSTDGMKILSGDSENTINEWCVKTGECLNTHERTLNYENDTGCNSRSTLNWSVKVRECKKIYDGRSNYVRSIAYSTDRTKTVSGDCDNRIREWSIKTGELLNVFEGHSDYVRSIVYNLEGTKILSGATADIKEWCVRTGRCIRTYKGHSDSILSITYSRDGTKILSGSADNTIKEWCVKTGKCIHTYEGHSNYVRSVVYSPDEKKILSGSEDNTIKEWCIETGKCSKSYVNINGFLMKGCSFKELHQMSNLSNDCIKIYKAQGILIELKRK